jgi:hypothetical protein
MSLKSRAVSQVMMTSGNGVWLKSKHSNNGVPSPCACASGNPKSNPQKTRVSILR